MHLIKPNVFFYPRCLHQVSYLKQFAAALRSFLLLMHSAPPSRLMATNHSRGRVCKCTHATMTTTATKRNVHEKRRRGSCKKRGDESREMGLIRGCLLDSYALLILSRSPSIKHRYLLVRAKRRNMTGPER